MDRLSCKSRRSNCALGRYRPPCEKYITSTSSRQMNDHNRKKKGTMVFTNNTTAIVTPVPGLQLPRLAPRRRQPSSSNPTSIPETPPHPPPPAPANLKFTHPTRRILSEHDHKLFLGSPAYVLITSFVFSLADAVRDTPTSAAKVDELSPAVQRVLGILDEAEEAVERCPPEDQGGSRFGNKSFRSFLDAIGKEYERWHRELGVNDAAAIDELSTYFLQAFGNRSRVDYGSGHELNFIAWLYVKLLRNIYVVAATNPDPLGSASTNSTLFRSLTSKP
jgi:serine/threonine-protein phosphatase 2A activator